MTRFRWSRNSSNTTRIPRPGWPSPASMIIAATRPARLRWLRHLLQLAFGDGDAANARCHHSGGIEIPSAQGILTKGETAARLGIHMHTSFAGQSMGSSPGTHTTAMRFCMRLPGRTPPVKQCSRWNRFVDREKQGRQPRSKTSRATTGGAVASVRPSASRASGTMVDGSRRRGTRGRAALELRSRRCRRLNGVPAQQPGRAHGQPHARRQLGEADQWHPPSARRASAPTDSRGAMALRPVSALDQQRRCGAPSRLRAACRADRSVVCDARASSGPR